MLRHLISTFINVLIEFFPAILAAFIAEVFQ
jgi:hypothetical protein